VHTDKKDTQRHWWTNGFWGGLNALLYKHTGNEEYFKTLSRSEELLDEVFRTYCHRLGHDVGFLWQLTSGAKYRLTGDEESKKRTFAAAALLMGRFVVGPNFIKCWHGQERVRDWSIIDTMMNLSILYHASEITGDDRYKRTAMAHADTSIAHHIRPDGSVAHQSQHDRETGEQVATFGGQGYAVGSSWSRGQSWAIYGYVISYIHTGEKRYLDTAMKVANYFIASCCDDWLPRADFRSPDDPEIYYDSTAGVCAACGMLELGRLLPEYYGGIYTHAAIKLLRTMTERFCDFDHNTDAILGYGSECTPHPERAPEKCGIHDTIIYGDFFYIEALLKILESDFFI
jgi:unsaturated chondroitin disaccharide hydrolase